MPRQAQLRQHKGYWCTNVGNPSGVYFGRVGKVSHAEAKRRFRDYLASLNQQRTESALPATSVAEVCDAHLSWVARNRSDALYRQRRTLLNQWCNHRIGSFDGQRLTGQGTLTGRLRAHVITRRHIEEYLEHRRQTSCERTGQPLGDKSLRAIVVAVKACWNWAAESLEDGGGGLLPSEHRPLTKLPRGYVQPKDLTEADLPSDEEIERLFRWAAVDLVYLSRHPGKKSLKLSDNPDHHRFADMLKLYHETGARTSELCSALVRDFMPRTKQLCLGKHKRTRTQHNPTVRNIQLSSESVVILQKHIQGKNSDDPLFVRQNGKAWDQGTINKRMKTVRRAATEQGYEIRDHITPYSFRDLYISELLMIGTPTFQVAKMAGTSLREIERTYGHFFNRDLAIAQAKLAAVRHERKSNGKKKAS